MTSTSIVAQSSSGIHQFQAGRYRHRTTTNLPFNPIFDVSFSSRNNKIKINPNCVACNLSLGSFGTSLQKGRNIKRNFVVYNNIGAGNPLPSGPPAGSSHWRSWVVGIVISVILPLFSGKLKLGPLSLIKDRFDTALQSVEDIVETVEKVAGGVEKAAEDLLDDLPEGKFKRTVAFVEHIAERAARDADQLDDVIDKVQEEGEKLEECLETAMEKAKESDKEAKDQK